MSLGRSSRRQRRSALEAIRDDGCTCDPDFYMVDHTDLRIVHDDLCLLDVKSAEVDVPDEPLT